MLRLVLLTSILAAHATITAAQVSDEWIKAVHQLGHSITFPCWDSKHPVDRDFVANITVEQWMLPNFELLNPGDVQDNVAVSTDGLNITIANIKVADFGNYYCLLRDTSDTVRMVKWGLNMKGPYFVDLWDKYKPNVIMAFSVTSGFIAMVVIISAVYLFRWQLGADDTFDSASFSAEAGDPVSVVKPCRFIEEGATHNAMETLTDIYASSSTWATPAEYDEATVSTDYGESFTTTAL